MTTFMIGAISLAILFILSIVEDEGCFTSFLGFIMFFACLFSVFLMPNKIVDKAEKTTLTVTHTIYSKENINTNQQEYLRFNTETENSEKIWYYIQENEVLVPQEIQAHGKIVIEFTKDSPRVEITTITMDKEYLHKWSILHAFGFVSNVENLYTFYVPEGSVSDEIYLKYRSTSGENNIFKK